MSRHTFRELWTSAMLASWSPRHRHEANKRDILRAMRTHITAILLSGIVLLPAAWGQTPKPPAPKIAPMQTGILLVRSDKGASLSIDGKSAGDIAAGGFFKMSAVAGEHFIEAVEKDSACKWEKKVIIPAGMQVAEDVDFAVACPAKPNAGAPTSRPANSAPPAAVATPAVVDPKIKEATELIEQGCRLYFLDRVSEAVPILEKAAALMPDKTGLCLLNSRLGLENAQRQLAACGNPQIPSDAKHQKARAEQPNCRFETVVYGYELGDMSGLSNLNYIIHEGEQGLRTIPSFYQMYERRARLEYALGNQTDSLHDFQTALDRIRQDWANSSAGTLEQREMVIASDESNIYLQRAVVESDIGNNEAAAQDCRMALASKYFIGIPKRDFCTRLTTALAASDSSQHGASTDLSADTRSVDDEIRRISSGQYAPMPPAQASVGTGSGSPRLTIENGTQYEIHVYLSGRETRSVSVQPGATSVLDLPAGAFRLAAEIPNSSIMPFYGEQTFSSGVTYVEKFYIQRVQ